MLAGQWEVTVHELWALSSSRYISPPQMGGRDILSAASDLERITQFIIENRDLVVHKHIFSALSARTDLLSKITWWRASVTWLSTFRWLCCPPQYLQWRISPGITQAISTCSLHLGGKHTFVPITEAISFHLDNDERGNEKRWEQEMESTH